MSEGSCVYAQPGLSTKTPKEGLGEEEGEGVGKARERRVVSYSPFKKHKLQLS